MKRAKGTSSAIELFFVVTQRSGVGKDFVKTWEISKGKLREFGEIEELKKTNENRERGLLL